MNVHALRQKATRLHSPRTNPFDTKSALHRFRALARKYQFLEEGYIWPHESIVDKAKQIEAQILEGSYQPRAPVTILGKDGSHRKHYGHLEDRLAYLILESALKPFYRRAPERLGAWPSLLSYPCSSRLKKNRYRPCEFQGPVRMNLLLLNHLQTHNRVLACFDVEKFSEHVKLDTLISLFQKLGASNLLIDRFAEFFNCFAVNPGEGGLLSPVGARDFTEIVSLVMIQVSKELEHAGFTVFRSLDDFRVTCTSEKEAEEAKIALSALLEPHGLTLNSRKTAILSKNESKAFIERVLNYKYFSHARRRQLLELKLFLTHPLLAKLHSNRARRSALVWISDVSKLLEPNMYRTPEYIPTWFDEVLVSALSGKDIHVCTHSFELLYWRSRAKTPLPNELHQVVRSLYHSNNPLANPFLKWLNRLHGNKVSTSNCKTQKVRGRSNAR